jgi:hypothetical protein
MQKSATADLIAVLDLIAALDLVVMERLEDGSFRIIGITPEWFMRLYPDAAARRNKLQPEQDLLFLENFLIDAEAFWQENRTGRLKSGPWSEIDPAGNECHLEASAVCLQIGKVLLIELLGTAYEEQRTLMQKARATSLQHHQLVKEVRQKETLLRSVVRDMAGLLTVIKDCLALLAAKELTPDEQALLAMGVQQAAKQEALMQEILDVFPLT